MTTAQAIRAARRLAAAWKSDATPLEIAIAAQLIVGESERDEKPVLKLVSSNPEEAA